MIGGEKRNDEESPVPGNDSGSYVRGSPRHVDEHILSRLARVKDVIRSEDPTTIRECRDTVESIEFNSRYTASNDVTRGIASFKHGTETLLDELGIRLEGDDRDEEVNELMVDIMDFIVEKKGAV